MNTCVLCETEAVTFVNGIPICARHHNDYIREKGKSAALGKWKITDKRPVTLAISLIASKRLEQRTEREQVKTTFINIYVSYKKDHFEIWLGPDWRELSEEELGFYFPLTLVDLIVDHKDILDDCCALRFKHPYFANISLGDIRPDLIQYDNLVNG